MGGGRFRTFVVVEVVVVVVDVGGVVVVEVVDFFLDLGFDFCLRFGASSAATTSSFVAASSLFVDFDFFFDDFFFPPPPVAPVVVVVVVVARCSCARFLQMYSKSAVDFLVVVDSDLGVVVVVALRPPSSRSRSSASTNDRYASSSSIVPALSTVSTRPNVAAYVSGVHALGARSTLAVVVSAASSVAFPSASLARTRNVVPWYASIMR